MDLAQSGADLVMGQVPGFIVGIVTGLITGVLTGLLVARHLDRHKRRQQVRQVTASVTRTWESVAGHPGASVMTGGSVTIRNNSEWPVRHVYVLGPGWLRLVNPLPYLGPGDERTEQIPHDVLLANPEIDPPITLQITDDRGKTYQWRPATGQLFDGSWIPRHCRPVQRFARRFPSFWSRHGNPLMYRLPMKVSATSEK